MIRRLMYGAARGMVGAMEALVTMGANIEAADQLGRQALHYALESKQEAAALFLLQRDPGLLCSSAGSGAKWWTMWRYWRHIF